MPTVPAIPAESFKLSRMLTGKFAEIIVMGRPVAPERAIEIIRRTDAFFWDGRAARSSSYEPLRDFARNLDRTLGFPGIWRFPPEKLPHPVEYRQLVKFWCDRWGALDTRYVFNQQILYGKGFCYPDGSVVYADEVARYPSGTELWRDFQMIARAFPDLRMDVAIWCDHRGSLLGFPMSDGLEPPWPPELVARISLPTVGFLVRDGSVTVVRGFDRRLFSDFGMGYAAAMEHAFHQTQRFQRLMKPRDGAHSMDPAWLTDAVLKNWSAKARACGLLR